MIRHEGLGGGDRLPPERELAERLGVSRASLREALRALEVAGLLESRHGGGTYVRDPMCGSLASLSLVLDVSDDMVGDLWEVRVIFEPPIAARAARRATPADIELLEQIVERMGDVGHGPAAAEQANILDRSFHSAVVGASGNVAAQHVLQVIHQHLQQGRHHLVNSPSRWSQARIAHGAILDAIRHGQSQAAHDAMLEHLQDVEAFILGSLIQPGSTPVSPSASHVAQQRAGAARPSGRRHDDAPAADPRTGP